MLVKFMLYSIWAGLILAIGMSVMADTRRNQVQALEAEAARTRLRRIQGKRTYAAAAGAKA